MGRSVDARSHACLLHRGGGGCTQRVAWTPNRGCQGKSISRANCFDCGCLPAPESRPMCFVSRMHIHAYICVYIYPPVFTWRARAHWPPSSLLYVCDRRSPLHRHRRVLVTYVHTGTRIRNSTGDWNTRNNEYVDKRWMKSFSFLLFLLPSSYVSFP